ncbi:MAG TPA: ABC transporter [Ruminococcaceae bacterium]|nr:ABC transporter [Oscillospiraceae bacterium]
MIKVSHLTKQYGEKFALNDISFQVNDGEILGFLGPNGAGKSTTMNIITGYLSSNKGTVNINGIDVLEKPLEAKKLIGYLPEMPPLYQDMTVNEYLRFVYGLKKCKFPREAHLEEVCGLVRIQNVRNRLIRNLSKGFKQRVGIAQALIGNPDVLILDEPTVGLDPKQIIEIRTLIKHLSHKHTVILSSHILPEVQSVCERIVIINQGCIVADDTPTGLSEKISGEHRLTARIAGPEEEVREALYDLSGVQKILSLGEHEKGSIDWQIESRMGKDIRRELFSLLAKKNWPLLSLTTGELSLEDIFLRVTSGGVVPSAPLTSKSISNETSEKIEEENSSKQADESVEESPANESNKEDTPHGSDL